MSSEAFSPETADVNPRDWEAILRENPFSRDDLEEIAVMMSLELKHLFEFLPSDSSYTPLFALADLPGFVS